MAETLPDARVLIVLREPVDALWSHYRFVRSHLRIDEDMDFAAYVEESRRLMASGHDELRENNAYVAYRGGYYHKPLTEWSDAFGDRLRILFFDDLHRDVVDMLSELMVWLDIDPGPVADFDFDVLNKSVQIRNRTLQQVALRLNKSAKSFFRNHHGVKRVLRSTYYAVNKDRTPAPRLDPEMRARLRTEYADSNVAAAELIKERGLAPGPLPPWLSDLPSRMSGVGTKLPADEAEALDCVVRSVAGDGGHGVGYRVLERHRLPGSTALIVELTGSGAPRELFVKRLHPEAAGRHRAVDDGRDRPRVKPVPDPATRLSEEAAALAAIEHMVAAAGRADWFAVPVVAVPECPDTLVLDRIVAPTLTERIAGGPADAIDRVVHSTGQWLQTLHTSLPHLPHARPHVGSAVDLAELARTMIAYIDSRRLNRYRGSILEAIDALPATFPVVPSHGDLAPQNVFVTDDERIAVFDTTGALLMPRHYDLAYFSVVLEFADSKRLLGRGSGSASRLAERLRAGYGPDLPPHGEIVTFELVLLLDRWCSISRRPGGSSVVNRALRWGRRQVLADRLVQGLTRRLSELGRA